MPRLIQVRRFGEKDTKEVTLQEAQRIVEETYNDQMGGLVADAKTREIISHIGPDVEEIIIVEQMLGGG